MALQVYSASPRTSMAHNHALQGIVGKRPAVVGVSSEAMRRKWRGLSLSIRVKTSMDDAAAAVAEVGQVTEVTKDTFWPIVEAAGDKTVVLNVYTQW